MNRDFEAAPMRRQRAQNDAASRQRGEVDAGVAEPIDTKVHKSVGFRRVFKAGGYSVNGLRAAYLGEAAFRQECWLSLIAIATACFLPLEGLERAALISVTVLVLIVELLNSAIEAVVDRVGFELHPLSGQAKDMGSAAVLVSLLLWAYVWGEVLMTTIDG